MMRRLMAAGCVFFSLLACEEDSTGGSDVRDVVATEPTLAINLEAGHYGVVPVGSSSVLAFLVSNVGDSATGPLDTNLSGDGFVVRRNDCTGSLRPNASCRITVELAPTTAGAKAGTLSVSAEPGGSVSATLDGDGVAPGALSITTSTSDLGTVAVGATSATAATFTVTNTGDTASGTIAVKGGGDLAHFHLRSDACQGQVLAPAASCTFEVAFAPKAAGDQSATYIVRARPGGEVSATISGVARTPAALSIAPRYDLGDVALGASNTIDVVVTNRGGMPTGPLTLGIDHDAFTATGCPASLEGGQTCTLRVVFAPDALGDADATLTVSGPNPVTAALSGEGVATQLRISPSDAIVDPTVIDTTSITHRFVVTNIAERDSGVLDIDLDGVGGPFVFVAQPDDCNGRSLAPRATCAIGVALAPTAAGAASAELVVTGAGSGTVRATLSGVGLTPSALILAPDRKDFGAVPVGRDAAQAFTITNTGGVRSGRITATLSGPDAARFRIASNPCVRVGPGRSCTLLVRFRPDVIAVANATLTISAEPGGTQVATLTGEGVDPQQLTIAPTAYTFAPTALGESLVQTFVVTDDSKAATGRIAVDLEGRNASEYAVDHDCTTLAPQGTCTITVTFAPRSLGARDVRLVVSGNPGGVASATLSGIGRPRVEVVDAAGDAINTTDFGDAVVGTTAPTTREILVRNNSADTVPLTLSPSLGSPAQFAVVSSCPTIAAGDTCAVQVSFAPTVLGTRTGKITFGIGSGRFDRVTQTLVGRGIDALTLTPETTATFGAVPLNTSARRAFLVTNATDASSSGPLTVRVSGNGYGLSDNACANVRLAPGASCRVEVTFAPPTKGTLGGSLSAIANPGGAPRIALTATGIDPIGAAATTITLTPSNVLENAPADTVVGTLTNDDTDAGDSYTYTLVTGSGSGGNANFRIDGDQLIATRSFDREATPTQSVRVRLVDSGGQLLVRVLTITVDNVDEPAVLADDTFTVEEDAVATRIDVLANDVDPDTEFVITAVTQGAHGAVAIVEGALTYTPAAQYCSTTPDTFTYTTAGVTANVAVTITCVDDPTTPVNDATATTQGDPAKVVDVLANDTDPDGNKRIIAVTQPAEGTVVIIDDGARLTYQASANPTLTTVTFTYQVVGGATGTVTVTVTILDDAPVAVADALTVAEDAAATPIAVLANDTDSDGGPMLVQSVTQPANGVVVLAAGVLTYTPNANYANTPPGTALDTFTYTLNGGSIGTVTVTVAAVDDPAIAVADVATTTEESAQQIDVLTNDVDVDGGAITIASVTQPANGVVDIIGPSLIYTPNSNYASPVGTPDTFTYTLGGGSTATVSVTVIPVDDAPVAVADAFNVFEDAGAVPIDLMANDTDIDGGPRRIQSVTQPSAGVVVIVNDGASITFTPNADYQNTSPAAEPTTFTYTLEGGSTATVSATVIAVDDAPVANNDSVTTPEDTALPIDVLANDSDIDAGPIAIAAVTQPANGMVVFTASGVTYTPNGNYSNNPPGTTPDTFTYTLTSGSTATVSVTVTAVDDAPTAFADVATVAEDSSENQILVLDNDIDVDGGPIVIASVTQPVNGRVFNNGTRVAYTPNANYANTPPGTTPDTFTYTLVGGSTTTVSVTVTAVDDPATAMNDAFAVDEDTPATALAVLANDGDVDGEPTLIQAVTQPLNGQVVITGGGSGLTYAPNPDYQNTQPEVALDEFTYTVNGGATATVSVTVTNIDDPAVAVDDSFTVAEDSFQVLRVRDNDIDIDGGFNYVLSVTEAANATVIVNTGSMVQFQPDDDFHGTTTFTYTLNTGSSATVTVIVTPVEDAPRANFDIAVVVEDSGPNAIDVLANDIDVEGDPFAIQSVTQPANGQVVITGGGTGLTYTPNADYTNDVTGTFDEFTYTLTPGGSTTTVAVTVNAVNDPPGITGSSAYVVIENTTAVATFGVTDPDGPTAIWSLGGPDSGLFTITGGVLTFVASPDFELPTDSNVDNLYQVTVTVSDGQASATMMIAVTVTNTNETGVTIDIPVRDGFPATLDLTGMIHVFDEGAGDDNVTVTLEVDGILTIDVGNFGDLVTVTHVEGSNVWVLTGHIDDVAGVLEGEQGATVTFQGNAASPLTVTLARGEETFSDTSTVAGFYITVPYVMIVAPGESRPMNGVIIDPDGAAAPGVINYVVANFNVATVTNGVLTAGMTDNTTTEVTATSDGIIATYTTAVAVRSSTTVVNGTILPASMSGGDSFSAFGSSNGRPTTSYYADIYRIELLAGQTLTVTMDTGDDLDSYLLLAFATEGFLVAGNDDDDEGILGVGSRMVYTATASGTYFIEASTFNGLDTGNYTLGVIVN